MVKGLEAPALEEEEQAIASTSQGVVFVLENAILEAAKVGKVCLQTSPPPAQKLTLTQVLTVHA